MTGRFEYEIDTSKALESWNVEIQENLRRQQEEKEAAEKAGVDSTETAEV